MRDKQLLITAGQSAQVFDKLVQLFPVHLSQSKQRFTEVISVLDETSLTQYLPKKVIDHHRLRVSESSTISRGL